MPHTPTKLTAGLLIPVMILFVAARVNTIIDMGPGLPLQVDENALVVKRCLEIIALIGIGTEVIWLIEQFAMGRKFKWRVAFSEFSEFSLWKRKTTWVVLPFVLAYIAFEVDTNSLLGQPVSKTVANLLLIAAMAIVGYSLFWVIKSVMPNLIPKRVGRSDFSGEGVFFGIREGRRRRSSLAGRNQEEDGHILVVGGAGSGKSSCIAIPTLQRSWTSNFLAIDIKGELEQKSGRRAHVFNPCKANAYGYDPFYFVEQQDNPTAALQEIALTLIPEPPNAREPFWVQSAQSILTGHLIFAFSKGASFYEALRKVQTVETGKLLRVAARSEEASIYVTKFLDTPKETLGSIMAQVSNHIVPLIGDPNLREALTKEDKSKVITPDMLDQGESIFLQIPMAKIDQWKQFITLIVQQFLAHFQRREEGAHQPVLFLLDEFPRFGKMDGILNGLATLRSKKVTICIIVQSLAQLDAIYGQDNRKVIADNCVYKAVLGASDADTQQYFSRMAGTYKKAQITTTKPDFSMLQIFSQNPPQSSTSTTMVDEPIIRPEELGRLGDYFLLLTPDSPATFLRKYPYYQW